MPHLLARRREISKAAAYVIRVDVAGMFHIEELQQCFFASGFAQAICFIVGAESNFPSVQLQSLIAQMSCISDSGKV